MYRCGVVVVQMSVLQISPHVTHVRVGMCKIDTLNILVVRKMWRKTTTLLRLGVYGGGNAVEKEKAGHRAVGLAIEPTYKDK